MKKRQKQHLPVTPIVPNTPAHLPSDDPHSHAGKHRTLSTLLAGLAVLVALGVGVWGIWSSNHNADTSHIDAIRDQPAKIVIPNTPSIVYKEGQPLLSYVLITNQGLTDAVQVKTQVSYLKFPEGTAEAEIQKDLAITRDKLPFLDDAPIPARSSRRTETHTVDPFSRAEKADIHDGKELFYLSEAIKYSDNQGIRHSTSACFRIAGGSAVPDDIRGLFVWCPFGNLSD